MIELPERWLFICSHNYVRSPTAEYVARKMGLCADSCGTDEGAMQPLSLHLIAWADIIVCMEPAHVEAVRRFEYLAPERELFCWNLPDEWGKPYDSALVLIITHRLGELLDLRRMKRLEKTGRPRE